MHFKQFFMALALIAGFGLALGGCSSSSTDDPPEMAATPEMPDGEDNSAEQQQAAEDALVAAGALAMALTAESTEEEVAAAEAALATARAAIAAATDVDAETLATLNSGADTIAMAIAPLRMALDDARDMAMMDEADLRAAGLHEALTRSDGVNDIFTGGPNGTSLTVTPVQIPQAGWTSGTPTDIVVTRGLSGDLSVTRDRAGWHDPAMMAAPTGEAGWAGRVLSSGTQTITVHSNIANAVRADFEADTGAGGSIYQLAQAAGLILHLPTANTDTPTGPSPQPTGLHLDATAMQDAYDQGLLDPRFFPGAGATGSRTLIYNYSATAAPGPRNFAGSFVGTFHGASGTYTCTSDPCRIDVTPANLTAPANYVVTTGNTWTFTPDRESGDRNDAQLHRQDSNWLSFGWWLNRPEAPRPGGAFLYNAQVFYGGANQYNFTSIAGLDRNNFTYEGPAGGLYARTANPVTDVESAEGEFAADATLRARFGLGTSGSATADVSGTIDNFRMTSGTPVDMSGWTLNLQRTAAVTLDSDAGTGSGAAGGSILSGDAGNRAGTWEYQLYGPNRPGEYPTGVAGRFFASIDGNTAVAGAFGAE